MEPVNLLIAVASLPPKRSLLQEPLEGFEDVATHERAYGGGEEATVMIRCNLEGSCK